MLRHFRELWQNGYEGHYVDDLISGAFTDFPPYAGADHQRVSFNRYHGGDAVSSLLVEDNGDFSVNFQQPHVGSVFFNTIGDFLLHLDAKIPFSGRLVRPTFPLSCSTGGDSTRPYSWSRSHPPRFCSSPHVTRLVHGLQVGDTTRSPHAMGELELSAILPQLLSERRRCGVRVGPFALRLTSTPQSHPDVSLENTKLLDSAAYTAHTIEGSITLPVGSGLMNSSKNAPSSAPWAATLSVEHPLTTGVTYLAFSAHGNRLAPLSSLRSQMPAVCDDGSAGDETNEAPHGKSGPRFYDGVRGGAPSSTVFRFLIVQTVLSKTLMLEPSPMSSMSDPSDTVNTRSRIVYSDTPWYELGTMIGCTVSMLNEGLRLSLASVFHNRQMDVEVAVTGDATPVFPSTPMLVTVGFNRAGRVGVGITSLLAKALSLTLGIHLTPGEPMRFGLQLNM